MKNINFQNARNRLSNSKDGRTLIANLGYLTLLQIAGYIFPLITIPYLARIIGVDGFGKIAFASAIIVWFQTVSDWGFNFTATRDVSRNRDNTIKVSEIFSCVFWARCVLMFVSFFILLICMLLIPKLQENAAIIWATFLLIPGHIMFPDWFFQAVERMKYTTYLNLLFKALFTIAVFLFVKDENDYIIQPLITSLGYVICGLITMYIIIYRWGIKLKMMPLRMVWQTIKSSSDVFLNNIFPNIYKAFSTILLGFLSGSIANGLLDAGAKFEDIASRFIAIISRTFFPFLSRRIDKHTFFAKINLGISLLGTVVLFFGAPIIIKIFFTEEFYEAIPILRIMSLSIIFLSLSSTYGTNYLIITGHEMELRNLTIVCSLIGLCLSVILIYFLSYIGAAIAITSTRGMLGFASMVKVNKLKSTNHNNLK